MQHVEDLRAVIAPTIRMGDAEKKSAREAIVAGFLPAWAMSAEKNILSEPFFGGAELNVVDLKLHMAVVHRRKGRPYSRYDFRQLPQTYWRARRRSRPSRREVVVREEYRAALGKVAS